MATSTLSASRVSGLPLSSALATVALMPFAVTSMALVTWPVRMLTPWPLKDFSTCLLTSWSSMGSTRSSISMTVTSVPKAL